MSDPSTFLDTLLGVNVRDLVAGFSGGVLNAIIFKRTQPWAFVSSVVAGTLTAAYIAPVIGHYTGTTGGAAAFITGLCAMAVCQGLVSAASGWSIISKPRGNDNAN